MKIRFWLRENNNSLKPVDVLAQSRKDALSVMKKYHPNQEIYKIERWVKSHWKTFTKPI